MTGSVERHPAVGDAGQATTFGSALRAHRTSRGISLNKFAALVHFDRGYVSKIENGKRQPSVEFAMASDRVLDLGDALTGIASAAESRRRSDGNGFRPAELPSARRHFIGRTRFLDVLDRMVHGQPSLAVPVVVVTGPAGVGKTALAVQWAHRAVNSGRFADGQLFVALRDPQTGLPVDTATVLGRMLTSLDVPAEQIPATVAQRTTMLRSRLHGTETLVVLDDADDAAQIASLLPGTGRCAVVVTSRLRLVGLYAISEASRLALDPLTAAEGTSLLGAIIGDQQAAREATTVSALAKQCAYLPADLVRAAEHVVSHRDPYVDACPRELASEHLRWRLPSESAGLCQAVTAMSGVA